MRSARTTGPPSSGWTRGFAVIVSDLSSDLFGAMGQPRPTSRISLSSDLQCARATLVLTTDEICERESRKGRPIRLVAQGLLSHLSKSTDEFR